MLFRDFRTAALDIISQETDAWVRLAPLGASLTLSHASFRASAILRVRPLRTLLPAPPDGGYTMPAWTVEVDGLDHAWAMFGAPAALALLRLEAPRVATVVRDAVV